jgi:hypothetical protein
MVKSSLKTLDVVLVNSDELQQELPHFPLNFKDVPQCQ